MWESMKYPTIKKTILIWAEKEINSVRSYPKTESIRWINFGISWSPITRTQYRPCHNENNHIRYDRRRITHRRQLRSVFLRSSHFRNDCQMWHLNDRPTELKYQNDNTKKHRVPPRRPDITKWTYRKYHRECDEHQQRTYNQKMKFTCHFQSNLIGKHRKRNLPNRCHLCFVPNLSTKIPTIGVAAASPICPSIIKKPASLPGIRIAPFINSNK